MIFMCLILSANLCSMDRDMEMEDALHKCFSGKTRKERENFGNNLLKVVDSLGRLPTETDQEKEFAKLVFEGIVETGLELQEILPLYTITIDQVKSIVREDNQVNIDGVTDKKNYILQLNNDDLLSCFRFKRNEKYEIWCHRQVGKEKVIRLEPKYFEFAKAIYQKPYRYDPKSAAKK